MREVRTLIAVVLLAVSTTVPAAAGYWESYGVCSFHTTDGSLDKLQLVAESACHEVTGRGTGVLQSTFTWDSGQVMTYGYDVQPSIGVDSETLNGRPVLEEINTDAGVCRVVKEAVGFSASCFRRVGESF